VKFSLCLPVEIPALANEFITGEAVTKMARAAEAAGFAAVNVTDHPIPEDRWMAGGGHHALDPLVVLTQAGAATTRLRLHTHIVVLGYRNPFLLAKGVMTLDRLSGGRVILGVAAGYLRPEFRALGVDYDERNELADEAIRAMKAAWTGESFRFEGLHFDARGHTMLPRPVQEPHPPVWVGGNSKRAIRRAVDLGDGWVPFPNPDVHEKFVKTPALETLKELGARIAYLREYASSVGRKAPLDISFAPLSRTLGGRWEAGSLLRDVEELSKLGVGWMAIRLPGETLPELLGEIERFAGEVMSRV